MFHVFVEEALGLFKEAFLVVVGVSYDIISILGDLQDVLGCLRCHDQYNVRVNGRSE